MKLAIKAGLHPPIGASPGELRLWLKLNGLMDNGMKHADRKNHRIAQVGRRPAAGAARLPPLQKRAPLADCNVPRPLPSTYGRKKLEQAPPRGPPMPVPMERPSGVSMPPRAMEPEDSNRRYRQSKAAAAEVDAAAARAAAARAAAAAPVEVEAEEVDEADEALGRSLGLAEPVATEESVEPEAPPAEVEAAVSVQEVVSAPTGVDEEPAEVSALEVSAASLAVHDEALPQGSDANAPEAAIEQAATDDTPAVPAAAEGVYQAGDEDDYAADDYEAESIELVAEPEPIA